MSVVDFIEKLQKKPRYIRIQIMWLGVALSSFILVAFWLWSLSVSIAESSKAPVANESNLQKLNEIKKEMPGLWQSLSAGVGSIIDATKTNLYENNEAIPSASPMEQPAEALPIE